MSGYGPVSSRPRPYGLWLLGVVLAAAGLALQGTELNVELFHVFNGLAPRGGAGLASWGSVLGLGAVPLVLAAAAGPRRGEAAAAVLLALLVCGVTVQLLKFAAATPRPLVILGPEAMHLVGAALRGRAMPSGHAAAGACAAAMAWAAAGLERRLLPAALLLAALALLEACARVVVGAHWPSDVLAGAGLGVLSGGLVYGTEAGRRLCARLARALRSRAGSILFSAAVMGAAVSVWGGRGDYPLASPLYPALALLAVAGALRWLSLHLLAGDPAGPERGAHDMGGAP